MFQAAGYLCAASAMVTILTPAVLAQDEQTEVGETSQSSGTTSFTPDDFARFNPLTALDMVSQVPGFSIDNGDNVRGFGGAAGNVLIDGERPSTKSSLRGFLGRIPASNVERIDLVRGASAGLDMRGQTRVVNVILKEGVTESQTTWLVNVRRHQGGRLSVYADADWSGKLLGGDASFSLEHENWAERGVRPEQRFDANRDPIAFRDQYYQLHFREIIPSGEYERDLGENTVLRTNFLFWDGYERLHEALDTVEPLPDGTPVRFERGFLDETFGGYVVGGDIENTFSDSLSTKFIWYQRRGQVENTFTFTDTLASGQFGGSFDSKIDDEFGESILRSQTTWTPNEKHSIEFGLEGAYNFRDSAREFISVGSDGAIPDDIPITTTKGEELRFEAFISDVWKVAPKWVLEPGLKFEVSEIEQSGDAEASRTFEFSKPSLTATYSPEENHQWTLLIERRVGQLNFGDFVSNVSATDARVTSGNPELEPEQSWRFELSHERPFLREGTINITARYDHFENLEDLVPVIAADGSVFDGPGNLGTGRRYHLETEASLPTDRWGIPNGRLDFEIDLQNTRVDDPVTGESRRFSGRQDLFWYVEFRQDFPASGWSWGFDYAQGSDQESFRVSEQTLFERGLGDFDIYVETTRYLGLNIRLGLDNAGDQTFTRTRTLFDGTRDLGVVSRVDVRDANFGPLPFVRVKGQF